MPGTDGTGPGTLLPMSVTWDLHHTMPADLFEEMKVAAG